MLGSNSATSHQGRSIPSKVWLDHGAAQSKPITNGKKLEKGRRPRNKDGETLKKSSALT